MEFKHIPVLFDESIRSLNIKPDGIYVDGTLGGMGHSRVIVSQLSNNGRLIGIDRDINAMENASMLMEHEPILSAHRNKIILVRDNFSNIIEILNNLNIEKTDGFLLDLGVSSYQLDEPSRGFSYMNDAPLDMRMDTDQHRTAYDIINHYSEKDLYRIISDYGEERWAKRIAEFIVKDRGVKPIQTTFELVSVIKKAVPKSARLDGPHPAKRTFQAIRIEVNQELDILEKTIENMIRLLNSGGRLCIITFHSLEDRIVKSAFRTWENPCTCPHDFPICVCNKKPLIRLVNKKPILPAEAELDNNHRARSAKLRVCERL